MTFINLTKKMAEIKTMAQLNGFYDLLIDAYETSAISEDEKDTLCTLLRMIQGDELVY